MTDPSRLRHALTAATLSACSLWSCAGGPAPRAPAPTTPPIETPPPAVEVAEPSPVADAAVPSPEESLDPSELEAEPLEAEPVAVESLVVESTEPPAEPSPAGEPAAAGALDGADAATLLADSLAAYEAAHALWDQGLVDEAFATLDRAYEQMAAVDVELDPLRAQEKEDLRRLISRRVVEIYASRLTSAGDLAGSIPLEINEHVQREIASFSGPERQFFLESYARAGQFRPMIVDQLRAGGMPLELAWMPMVESGFKVRAYSVARALGLWQFIPSTGYRFGLERSHWIDERMDPHKSTAAAIAYLNELHALFGDWLTALAAYNCGEHLVLRLLNSQPVSYFDHFWDLYLRLPRETRRYVPRFLATLAIIQDPEVYGFDLPPLTPPVEWEIVHTERIADLGDLERKLGLTDGTIKGLNPELRRNATPTDPYDVKVPKGMLEQVAAAIVQLPARVASTPPPAPSGDGTHRVRPGETLGRVAARYGTTVDALVALNGLSSPDRIWPGQTLRVHTGAASGGSGSGGSVVHASGTGTKTHRVRPGDNLWVIAQRYGTTVDRIKRDNGLRSNLLQVGQKLVIRDGRGTTGAG